MGAPYEWVHVRSGHPSRALHCSPWTEIIPSLQGLRGDWMLGWSDERTGSKIEKMGFRDQQPAGPGYIDQMGQIRGN